MTPEGAQEIERMKMLTQGYRPDRRYHYFHLSLRDLRRWQLYHTLLHEIGHWVDYLKNVVIPEQLHGGYAKFWEKYFQRPQSEREAFAHRFSDEWRDELIHRGAIPFARRFAWDDLRKEGIDPNDFMAITDADNESGPPLQLVLANRIPPIRLPEVDEHPSETSGYQAELAAPIWDNPNDMAAWHAYHDWLVKKGSLRARLFEIHDALERSVKEYSYGRDMIPLLMEEQSILDRAPQIFSFIYAEVIDWRLGFWQSVKMHGQYLQMLEAVLKHPSALFLYRLIIAETNDISWQQVLSRLKQSRIFYSLRELEIGTERPAQIGDLTTTWELFPKLEALSLCGSGTLSSELPLCLRSLSLKQMALNTENVEQIHSSTIPVLEKLAFSCENAAYEANDLLEFLENPKYGNLKSFHLTHCKNTDELCRLVMNTRHLKNLRKLDFSYCDMSFRGVQFLSTNREYFRHLDALDLTGNPLGAKLRKKITQQLKNVVFRQDDRQLGE